MLIEGMPVYVFTGNSVYFHKAAALGDKGVIWGTLICGNALFKHAIKTQNSIHLVFTKNRETNDSIDDLFYQVDIQF